MKQNIPYIAVAALLSSGASAASAACTVEYKAKQDNPLRLEHEKIKVDGPCTVDAVTDSVEAQLAERGWTLLKIVSVSDE